MKVALVNPPASRLIYGGEHELKSVIPCLGLFYLQSYCQDIADLEVFEGDFYSDIDDLVRAVHSFEPDILAITTNTSTYPLCIEIARKVNAPLRIAGGPYSSFRVEESLEEFDLVAIGDAEVALRSLVRGVKIEYVPGIAFRDRNGHTRYTNHEPLLELDSIPFPDHSRIQQGLYKASAHRDLLPEPFATMITTRGCGYLCSFCLSANKGLNNGRYRERSVQNVTDEVRLLVDQFGVRSIQFWDDTFTMRKVRTKALCKSLSNFDIQYVCNTRADKFDDEIAEWLAQSGCRSVFFGVESGDREVLDRNMRKGLQRNQIRDAIACCHRAGLNSTASFIFGAIDDTNETIEETEAFAAELNADYVLFNIYTAHPGTTGYYEAIDQGIIDEYKVDLDMFRGEPVGVPTICRNLSRQELQILKAEAYVRYYSRRGNSRANNIIQLYQQELDLLKSGSGSGITDIPKRWASVPVGGENEQE